MESIIRIVHYLFKKKNISITEDTIDSFFENGVGFPQLVAFAHNIEEIPGVNKNPKTKFHRNINNNLALQFLFQNNQDIAKMSPNFETQKDKIFLLTLILTKLFFKIDQKSIINKCNMIVKPLGIQFISKADLINQKCILSLLNVLTDGCVQVNMDTKNVDQIMIDSFEQAKIPLIIDKSSFEIQNQFIFLIQIEIIFECFQEKIKELLDHSQNDIGEKMPKEQGKKMPEIKEEQNKPSQPEIKEEQNKPSQSEIKEEQSKPSQSETKEKQNKPNQSEIKEKQNKPSQLETKEKQNKPSQSEIKEKQNKPSQLETKEKQNKPSQSETKEKQNKLSQSEKQPRKLINNKELEKQECDKDDTEINNEKQNIDELSDDSSSSDEHPTYNFELKEKIDKQNEKILLETINIIVKTKNLSFPNLLDAVKKDNLFKFVNIFFEEDQDFIHLMNSPSKKIDDIITFLRTKEPIFNVLLFNFKEPKYAYLSAMSFFKNFLNCFFIKKSKQELYERFDSIVFDVDLKEKHTIFSKMKNYLTYKHKQRHILFSWNAYMVLINFVNKRERNFRVNKNDINIKGIPLLFDQEYLNICGEKEQDALYYQLQFIFNVLDNQEFVYFFHECLLNAIKKIKQIKVPNYKKLANSIRTKNISLILQIKSYKKFSNKEGNIKNTNLNDYNSLKKDIIPLPDNFENRQLKKEEKPKEKQELQKKYHQSLSIQDPELFWNPNNKDNCVDNGILLLNKQNDQLQEKRWIDNILDYNKYIMKDSISDEEGPLFNSIPTRKVKPKLFKLFYFNEKTQKWVTNSDAISNFFQTKNYDLNKPKNPLVLCFNSCENDLITLNSIFINTLYPDLDDENIYVYCLYDKPITLLQYHINISFENSHITPIFLTLHVPKSKQKMENIKSILLKIYNFLSFVCDIEIVIMNNEHYMEQIDLIKCIKNIQSSYYETFEMIMKQKSPNEKKSEEELNQNDDEDLFSDYSDFEYSDEEQNTDESYFNSDMKDLNSLISNNDYQFNIKQKNYIILVNDDKIDGDITKVKKCDLFDYIKDQINEKSISINYININNHATYRLFFDCLNKFSSVVQTEYEDILNSFKLFQLTGISNIYVDLKCNENWKSEIKEVIKDRFNQMKESKSDESNDIDLLSQLNNEIVNFYPSIDSEFKTECNLILDEIKKEIINTKSTIITSELDISSKSHIDYLKKIINSQHYWSIDQKENIKNKHAYFIKNEFFNIIKTFYQRKDCIYIFEYNNEILQSKIEKDNQKIDQIFVDFEKQYESSENQVVSLKDEMNEGTNYSIRETERVKEIKVIVEAGHLQDAIEQDF